jgi:diguanylate cyclase (GGDEF)-like protein
MHKRDEDHPEGPGRVSPADESGREALPDDPAALAAQLRKSQLELETLKDALAVIEQETSIAREKIDTLSEIESFLMQENSFLTKKNSLLRSELAQLAKRETSSSQHAYRDELTGLPSRRVLLDRLKQAIALATRQHKRVALLFLHIEQFSQIKDKLGQEGSDKLLQALAERLNGCLRTADTVSHVGDDEFIVMLPEVDGPQSAAAVEQKIRNQLAKPYAVSGNTMPVAVTIGRAMYPVERQALHEVKEGGNVSIMPRKHDRK